MNGIKVEPNDSIHLQERNGSCSSDTTILSESEVGKYKKLMKRSSFMVSKDLTSFTRRFLRVENTYLRGFFGEFICTFILMSFSIGAKAQFVLYSQDNESLMNMHVAAGMGVTIAIIVSGNVSGGHTNPVLSLVLFIYGKISLLRFVIYVIAQFIGAFTGTALVYLVYREALNDFDGGLRMLTGPKQTATVFLTNPASHISNLTSFTDQLLGSFIFVLAVSSLMDEHNHKVQVTTRAFFVGLTVYLLEAAFSGNVGGAANPWRDTAPRLFLSLAGWGSDAFRMGNNFFWIPIVSDACGGVLAAFFYAIFIKNHWPNEATSSLSS